MAIKRQPNARDERPRYCGNCKHGEFYYTETNLDWEGKPICVKCKFDEWSKVRSRPGCGKHEFKAGMQVNS